MINFIPRPSQEQILRYRGGHLGIAAVPGAGKTQILSALAAQIIASGALGDEQEVLIVTLVNSAVDNFSNRIKGFFDEKTRIQALFKYRVRTLHGLAHDIVREKPARVGLEERFSIIDEREAGFIRRESVNAWLASHSLDDYLDPNLDLHFHHLLAGLDGDDRHRCRLREQRGADDESSLGTEPRGARGEREVGAVGLVEHLGLVRLALGQRLVGQVPQFIFAQHRLHLQLEHAFRVVDQDLLPDRLVEAERLEVVQPAFGADHRVVGAEHHLILRQRLRVLHQ